MMKLNFQMNRILLYVFRFGLKKSSKIVEAESGLKQPHLKKGVESVLL